MWPQARLLEPLLTADDDCALARRLRAAVRDVSANSKDIATLTVSLGLQMLLLPYAKGELLAEVLRAVVLLLGHRYPKVWLAPRVVCGSLLALSSRVAAGSQGGG